MKKIFALILAIVMMASMSVVAFAETQTPVEYTDATDPAGSLELTYKVDQGYTLSIPADIDFNEALENDESVSLTNVKIKGIATLTVSVASANKWLLVDAAADSDSVVYEAYYGYVDAENKGTKLTANAGVATGILSVDMDDADITNGAEGSTKMYFVTAGTSQVGEYSDTLTFSTSIVEA